MSLPIVRGFRFAGIPAGIKKKAGARDLALVVADAPCTAAAVLTKNLVRAAPVEITRARVKGGKAHAMPCHHNLEAYLHAYLDGTGIAADPKGPLFRTIKRGTGRGRGELTLAPLPQANAYAMIRRRAAAAGIMTKIGNHSFRATGITAYLKNGGTLEKAAAMANHASTRTTQLYDRRRDEMSLD